MIPDNFAPSAFPLAAGETVRRLQTLGQELGGLLMEEQGALTRRDVTAHGVLLARKQEIAREYYMLFRGLTQTPGAIAALDDSLRDQLRGLGERLRGQLESNAAQLNKARLGTEHLLRIIARTTLRHQQAAAPAYAPPATPGMKAPAPAARPVRFNETA